MTRISRAKTLLQQPPKIRDRIIMYSFAKIWSKDLTKEGGAECMVVTDIG